MTTASILRVIILTLALICQLTQSAPTKNGEEQDDQMELLDHHESHGARQKRSPYPPKFVTLKIDHHRYPNETSVQPAPYSKNSKRYSKNECAVAVFRHERRRRERRPNSQQPLSCENGFAKFKCDCDKGYFPPMCDYNEARLPQKISMVDCGRCRLHGEGSVRFPLCTTANNKTGHWTAQTMEIDLPFRHGKNSTLYTLKSQVITVGCYCREVSN